MDITINELKTMKAKQLRRLIHEAVKEVLAEGEAENKAADDAAKQNQQAQIKAAQAAAAAADAAKKAADAKSSAVTADKYPGLMEEENELEEMARIAKGFRLADPEIDSTTFTKSISGTPLSSVIDYFRQNPGAEKTQLQAHFGFVRPQIANAVVNGLLDAGILVKLGAGGEVEATPEPGEVAPTQASEPEDLFMGSAENPLAMYFDKEPNDDGTEDFNDEEEPTTGELEPAEYSGTKMSKEDYDAFMDYTELADRLAATKSNILKMKRSRGGTAGDISDKPGTELARLIALKDKLQTKVDDLVANSEYLQKRIEKQTGKAYVPPVAEPEEDEEDTIDEAFNADYEKRKLQFYAGIIK